MHIETHDTQSPSSPEVELTVLGTILRDYRTYFAATGLKSELFYLSSHREIFDHFKKLAEAGREPDFSLVADSLGRSLPNVGGMAYLSSLTDHALPRGMKLDARIETLATKHQYRKLLRIASDLTRGCYSGDASPLDLAGNAEKAMLDAMASAGEEKSFSEQLKVTIDKYFQRSRGELAVFVPSGIQPIDEKIGGYALGEMTVLGGRPAQGKSCTVTQATIANCRAGNFVHVFTPEMTVEQFQLRILSAISGVEFFRVRKAKEEWVKFDSARILKAVEEMHGWPIEVDGSTSITASELASKARAIHSKHDTKLIAVDYLQKLTLGNPADRFNAVSDAVVSISNLAKTTGAAVLLLSSLTEANGAKRNDVPTMQNLRLSGDIQFEASTVMLIHREIDTATEKLRADAQFIIAKARSDEHQGSMGVRFNGRILQWEGQQG